MKKLLYAGSFDPVTIGHMDVIRRAASLCDELIVAVMHNPEKEGNIPPKTRMAILEKSCRDIPNVSVVMRNGLLIDAAREFQVDAVVRGIRPMGDFEPEYQMAQINRMLGGVETLMLITSDYCSGISSSIVRQIAFFGGDITSMVPEGTAEDIIEALKTK